MISSKKNKFSVACAVLLCSAVIICQAQAQPVSCQGPSDINAIVLTPGHSQTILFELDSIVSHGEFHTCLLATYGTGRLTIRVGPASSVGEYAGLIYAVVGFMGVQPVTEWAYNAETISISLDVPEVSIGMLFTGIISGIGSPDFPIVMSLVVSLSG